MTTRDLITQIRVEHASLKEHIKPYLGISSIAQHLHFNLAAHALRFHEITGEYI